MQKDGEKKRKAGGKPFVKNDPRINRTNHDPRPGAGRPSEAHRAECRKLVEDLKIREFFGNVAKGDKLDFTVTMSGKVVDIPASIRNRLMAGLTLIEHGYGKAPQEITHSISEETLEKFQTQLLALFQKHFPKTCPHCRTALAMSPELASDMLLLSKLFEPSDVNADSPQIPA